MLQTPLPVHVLYINNALTLSNGPIALAAEHC